MAYPLPSAPASGGEVRGFYTYAMAEARDEGMKAAQAGPSVVVSDDLKSYDSARKHIGTLVRVVTARIGVGSVALAAATTLSSISVSLANTSKLKNRFIISECIFYFCESHTHHV